MYCIKRSTVNNKYLLTVSKLSSFFITLTPLAAWQEQQSACKNLTWAISTGRFGLTGVISGKRGWLKERKSCFRISDAIHNLTAQFKKKQNNMKHSYFLQMPCSTLIMLLCIQHTLMHAHSHRFHCHGNVNASLTNKLTVQSLSLVTHRGDII